MTTSIRKALLLDAFYQVLDNKIFRFLTFIVLGMVGASFVIGFREDQIEILYGWTDLEYEQISRFLGMSVAGIEDKQAQVIQTIQHLLVSVLAGVLGMVACVSATAFFVPHMLEKGSADISFSKPLSRLRLLLARYVAGVLFVSLLSIVLIGGIYLGLVVTSGYHDAGFLWSALTLIYLFSILHALSTCIGVVTRSTVAAILVSIIFFWFTGCVHQSWIVYEMSQTREAAELLREVGDVPPGLVPEEEPPTGGRQDPERTGRRSGFIRTMVTTLETLHYTLPKTTDADYISAKLLAAVTVDELADEEGGLAVERPPDGFLRVSPRSHEADLDRSAGVWELRGKDGRESGRIEIRRRSRNAPGEEGRPGQRVSLQRAERDYRERIESETTLVGELVEDRGSIDRAPAVFLGWTETGQDGPRARQTALFTFEEWLYEIEARFDPALVEGEKPLGRIKAFGGSVRLTRTDVSAMDPNWYGRQLGWTSELKFNLFFSIGSSVAFALLMLALGWWKLSRIDF